MRAQTARAPRGVRVQFLDDMRGVAALMVTVSHLVWLLPVPAATEALGLRGVQIFFVISGFVMAHSLSDRVIDGRFIRRFALRRSIRLDLPYWAILVVEVVILAMWNEPLPDAKTIAVNIAYLQEVLPIDSISLVAWTLCLELQFYLGLVALLAAAQWLARRTQWSIATCRWLVFAPAAALSITANMLFTTVPAIDRLTRNGAVAVPYWYMFFAGVLLQWVLVRGIPAAPLWLLLGTVSVSAVFSDSLLVLSIDDFSPIFVVAVAIVFFAVGQTSTFIGGLGSRIVAYFGRISYSLYLVHVPVGVNIIHVIEGRWGFRFAVMFPATVFAFAASVLAAELMYRFIEKPSVRLSRRVSYPPNRDDEGSGLQLGQDVAIDVGISGRADRH